MKEQDKIDIKRLLQVMLPTHKNSFFFIEFILQFVSLFQNKKNIDKRSQKYYTKKIECDYNDMIIFDHKNIEKKYPLFFHFYK